MTAYAQVWDLDSLLPNPQSDEFRKAYDQFKRDLIGLADRSENLPAPDGNNRESVDQWVAFLSDFETVGMRASDFNAFLGCHAAAEATNRVFQQWEAQLATLEPDRERISANVQFALQGVELRAFESFLKADKRLKELAFFLEESQQWARLRLPKDQELLAADLAVDGIHAWGRLYDRLSGSLKITVMEKGELVEKSPSQVQYDAADRSVRSNNFFAANKAWNRIGEACAESLNHIAGTRLTRYRRLGLEDHLVLPLAHNRMERATLETMWRVVTEKKSCLVKYLQAKAKLLGLKQLAWYDLQAPLPVGGGGGSQISYDKACDLIIKTFTDFSSDFGEFARLAIEKHWIEAENRAGKRQGGFCTGFPTNKESRIFMTYVGTSDNMSTLAHELGHAYHSYVLRDEPWVLQDYPMNLAETASTFAEAVLGDQQLSTAESDDKKLLLLDHMLSDAVSFMMNIHARFIFEDHFHRRRKESELSPEELSQLMVEAQREAYLNCLTDDGWNPGFWISKLHFYISGLPFYNFPYTFGYLLSLGIYSLAESFGAEFPARYRQFLMATGSRRAESAVSEAFGYHLGEPDFWEKSIGVVESRVEQFLTLADARGVA
ncbi:MAG: M3 family oligoendopeptidase [Planctomycetota bacterium]|nr:M3 family oligoendopeptidase [Planctomycetota bacterium]